MAATTIEWSDAVWNCVVGCTRVSPGCDVCYAARMTRRLEAMGQEDYAGLTTAKHFNGVVRCLEHKLELPLRWKKPRMVFVNSMSDLFHKDVPFEFIDRVFDVMWRTPQHTYQILTKRPERMVEFVRERASRKSFGWTDIDRDPLRPGSVIHLEDMYYRNQCGYVGEVEEDSEWVCDHPTNDERGGSCSCDRHLCPIASCLQHLDDLENIGVGKDYDFDSDGYTDGSEWMELFDRPRHAACANVCLGFSAENQEQYANRMRVFRQLRWILGPYFTLFCSMEPLLGPIDTRIKYWGENEGEKADWSSLEPYVFGHAGRDYPVPYLNWIISGCESGPKRRAYNPEWADAIQAQCAADGVAFFRKQEIVNGRVSHDMSEWAEHRRVREFPAQLTQPKPAAVTPRTKAQAR